MNITKLQLAAAFNKWLKNYNKNPEGFNPFGSETSSYGEDCAEYLTGLINKQKTAVKKKRAK